MLLFGAACPGTGVAADEAPWYVGQFSGELRDRSQTMLASINCDTRNGCEYTIEVLGAPQPERHRERTGKVAAVRVGIANNNLRYTREYLQTHPEALRDRNDGAALRSMKPVLESSNELTACVDISAEQNTAALLCRLSVRESSSPTALLLLTTMNPTCGRSAFCAYFFVPLDRRR